MHQALFFVHHASCILLANTRQIMQNYSATKKLTVSWTKADGSVVPLGTFSVTFERNVKTTVKIKAEEAGSSNGITVVKENVPMVDDDKEYQISGGTVTEVPVNNA